MSFQRVPSGLLECFEQWFTTDGKVWQGLWQKAFSDLNYVGHKTIQIGLPFTRSWELKHMKILGTEI